MEKTVENRHALPTVRLVASTSETLEYAYQAVGVAMSAISTKEYERAASIPSTDAKAAQ